MALSNQIRIRAPRRLFAPAALVAPLVLAAPAFAQDGRPGPIAAEPAAEEPAAATNTDGPVQTVGDPSVVPSPRRLEPGPIQFGLDDHPIDDVIYSFIAQATGKMVMPVQKLNLQNKKITLLNDAPVDQTDALDLLIQALRLNGVGVIERPDIVIVGPIDEVVNLGNLPVIPSTVDIRERRDKGSLVVKIFKLWKVKAEEIGDRIADEVPSHVQITVDTNSNQLVVKGDIGFCQYVQRIIEELDNMYVQAETRTFRLAHADATLVADNITELFQDSGSGGSSASARTQGRGAAGRGRGGSGGATDGGPPGPEIELRVTVNTQQNSVTVVGDPADINEIANLIDGQWDLPRSPGTSRIYTLQYTDPLKIAEKLNALLGQGTGGGAGGARAPRGGGGASTGVEQILAGIYRIEAYPDTNQLLVFCKTEQSLSFLDDFINQMDQPTSIGLPFVIELKHANAIELSQELNALLSEPGAGATIDRPDEGLFGRTDEEGSGGATPQGSAQEMNFPWQRGGRQRDDQSPESILIGKVRIVPIVRQNALAILCPSPQREAVRELIEYFDRPGRQVMISAVIAEIELNEDLNLGIRLSNSDDILGGANPDYRLGGVFGSENQATDVFSFFDTSILNFDFGVNVVLQALAQNTNVRIIQEPLIYTADNQEALFFDGQDIPFISDTTINAQGNPTDSFEYRQVGVVLNARPRITVQHDVDIEISLELSSVVPGQTLFGGAIIDRRETRTHVVVKDGQTIVISGLLRDFESKVTRKVPFLGDIPLIGELFKSRENTTGKTELLAFITPRVVERPEENDHNWQQDLRNRLQELSKPVDEQWKDIQKNPERYRDNLLRRRGVSPEGSINDADRPDAGAPSASGNESGRAGDAALGQLGEPDTRGE